MSSSMNELAFKVLGLGKKYRLGEQSRLANSSLREAISEVFQSGWQTLRGRGRANQDDNQEFWALKDVDIEIKRGEAVGIIGRNGAGKSTLLKILSRITEPTTGRVEGYGRVGSLLEVGTGFHPELSGRENIFLNGALLGMTRSEISRKFDEIVAFSEVEKFLDTPVKRYSSGMYVRLAFAVAAHLEPEILIVDEVLAVGDAAFQKKCLGKMETVTHEGRTILFVSHNMTAIQSLCTRAILFESGRMAFDGKPDSVVAHYMAQTITSHTERAWTDPELAPGNELIRFKRIAVAPETAREKDEITVNDSFRFEFEYWNRQAAGHLDLSIRVQNEYGVLIFDVGRAVRPTWSDGNIPTGLLRDTCFVPGNLLNNGLFRVDLLVHRNHQLIYQFNDALVFTIQDNVEFREGWYGEWPGVIRPKLEWRTTLIDE